MTKVNTIILTKSDAGLANVDEARTAIQTVINNPPYFEHMKSLRDAGTATSVESFDETAQTYKLVRTFDNDVYAKWNLNNAADLSRHKTALESAGWTVTATTV